MQALSPHRLTGIAASWAVWAVHFVTVYSLQGVVCAEDVWRGRLAGAEAATWILVAIGIAAIALTLVLGLRGLRAWRDARRQVQADAATRRRRFAAAITALSGLLAAIAISFTTVPVLMLPPCA